MGSGGDTAMQLASILGENKVKRVPDISVSGEGGSGLVTAMIARMLSRNGDDKTSS